VAPKTVQQLFNLKPEELTAAAVVSGLEGYRGGKGEDVAAVMANLLSRRLSGKWGGIDIRNIAKSPGQYEAVFKYSMDQLADPNFAARVLGGQSELQRVKNIINNPALVGEQFQKSKGAQSFRGVLAYDRKKPTDYAPIPGRSNFYFNPLDPESLQKGVSLLGGAGAGQPSGRFANAPAPTAAGARIQLPRFNLQGALKNVLLRSAVEAVTPTNSAAESIQIQQKADELADAGYQDAADVLESQAVSKMVQGTQSQGLDPVNLVQNILNLRKEQQSYDAEVSQIERSLNDVAASQVAQATGVNIQTAAKPGQAFMRTAGGGIAYPNAVVTSAVDATGEPGLDFALPGGENAMFVTPFNAEVLKVVRESNAANRGPGGRGYGNYVELRGVTPEGKPFDTLVAHFNQVNPNLKPGMKISAGTPVGTQGTTGRATGPHISMDFFEPGSTQASADILRIRDIVADRIKKGKAPFG
jgi:murein DD-endopeptidase MepM/ murein hydrolase activator NlpD